MSCFSCRDRQEQQDAAVNAEAVRWMAEAFYPTSGGMLRVRGSESPVPVGNAGYWGPEMEQAHEYARVRRALGLRGYLPQHRVALPLAAQRRQEDDNELITSDSVHDGIANSSRPDIRNGYVSRLQQQLRTVPLTPPRSPDSLEVNVASSPHHSIVIRPSISHRWIRAIASVLRRRNTRGSSTSCDTESDDLSPSAHEILEHRKSQCKLQRLLCCGFSVNDSLTSLHQDAINFHSNKNAIQPEIDRGLGILPFPSPAVRRGGVSHYRDPSSGLCGKAPQHQALDGEALYSDDASIDASSTVAQVSSSWAKPPVSPTSIPNLGAKNLRIANNRDSGTSWVSSTIPVHKSPATKSSKSEGSINSQEPVYIDHGSPGPAYNDLIDEYAQSEQSASPGDITRFETAQVRESIPTSIPAPSIVLSPFGSSVSTVEPFPTLHTPSVSSPDAPHGGHPAPKDEVTIRAYQTAQEYYEQTGMLWHMKYEKGGPREQERWDFQRKEWENFASLGATVTEEDGKKKEGLNR
ncbi:MAG: hypothetical protein Q9162_003604 [Coniocarpon cinnabarinum]